MGNTDLRQTTPGRSSVSIIYDITSYNWNNSSFNRFVKDGEGGRTFPILEITEFQPNLLYNYGEQVGAGLDVIKGGLSNLGSNFFSKKLGNSKTTQNLLKSIGGVAQVAAEGTIKIGSETYIENLINELDQTTANDMVLGTPIDIIANLLSGMPVANYELPFLDGVMLEVNSSKDWEKTGLEKIIGDKVGKLVKNNMPIDIPGIPEWNLPAGGGDVPAASVHFQLHNNNFTNLKNNFMFLQALVSGAFWTQLNYVKKSSNVYHVHCPGRFNYLFCTMDIRVNYSGMIRTLSPTNLKSLEASAFTGIKSLSQSGYNQPTFPDVYDIDITFTSLMPNSYNTYINYIVNGLTSNSTSTSLNGRQIKNSEAGRLSNTVSDVFNTIAGEGRLTNE